MQSENKFAWGRGTRKSTGSGHCESLKEREHLKLEMTLEIRINGYKQNIGKKTKFDNGRYLTRYSADVICINSGHQENIYIGL